MLVAIDLSLRCAGLVALDVQGNLVDQLLIPTSKELLDDEDLLLHTECRVIDFIDRVGATAVVLEGLAFGAKGNRIDLLDGNWWNLVKEIRQQRPGLLIGRIPVTTWRARVVTSPAARKRSLDRWGKNYHHKMGVYCRLPQQIKERFAAYLPQVIWPPTKEWTPAKKRDAVFDLADAYWLGRHRLTLGALIKEN